jgi:hypothetical protein
MTDQSTQGDQSSAKSDQTGEARSKPIVVNLNVTMEGAYRAPAVVSRGAAPIRVEDCLCACGSRGGSGSGQGGE